MVPIPLLMLFHKFPPPIGIYLSLRLENRAQPAALPVTQCFKKKNHGGVHIILKKFNIQWNKLSYSILVLAEKSQMSKGKAPS